MPLTVGTRLGVYEVTAQIGEGGMGQVYRATDTKLKRDVAVNQETKEVTHAGSALEDHTRSCGDPRLGDPLTGPNHAARRRTH